MRVRSNSSAALGSGNVAGDGGHALHGLAKLLRLFEKDGTHAQCMHDNLLVEPFLMERYSCAMRRGHPVTKKRFTRAVFEAWPHLMIDSALPQTGPINLTLEALGVRRSVTYSTQHLLTVHLALEQSDLIAIVADTIAQLYTRSADIITRKPPVDVGELSLFLASHPRHRSAPLHLWLRERLHYVAEQDPKRHRSPAKHRI